MQCFVFKIMPNVKQLSAFGGSRNICKVLPLCIVFCFVTLHSSGQDMLGYTDRQGNFYIYDTDRTVHLEHQQINGAQFSRNSAAYLSNTGELKYYTQHKLIDLDISNPRSFLNTDHYLYYSLGYDFSLYNGTKRQHLGILQNNPYAFSDSIAGMHDYAEYFYAYWKDAFIELEPKPVKHVVAGDNILTYVDDLNQTKIFYHNEKIIADHNPAYAMQCGANTVAFIDNYRYFKIFWSGKIFELFNLPEFFCVSGSQPPILMDDNTYCDAQVSIWANNTMPFFKTGDDIVAYIDDRGAFNVFFQGISTELSSSPPRNYNIADNMLWWTDDNDFFHVYYDGEDRIAETYTPAKILTDRNVVVYTDNYGKLKAFYRGESIEVSSSIVLSFEVNNTIIMYSDLPNKYMFYVLE